MMKTYIYKPGCNLQPKPNKTNLQIRELEAFQLALKDAGVESTLVTFDTLKSMALDLSGCSVICFNSAPCFQQEFAEFMRIVSLVDNVDVTLVSNDCRLNFNIDNYDKYCGSLVKHYQNCRANIRILTNASKDLNVYKSLICNWPEVSQIPVYYSNLFTLPTWLPGAEISEKTVDCVFACMHFKDYSDQRKKTLTTLKTELGDNLVLTGDMEGLVVNGQQVESIVTDTKVVWQWYKNAKTTPVLLEPNYDRFGVLPNRISEAINCRCIPVLFTENIINYCNVSGLSLPVVTNDIDINVLTSYIKQYDTNTVQQLLNRLQVQLGFYRTLFITQLQTYYHD